MSVIRERDEGGYLVASGFGWFEINDFWQSCIMALCVFGVIAFVLGLYLVAKTGMGVLSILIGGLTVYGAHRAYPYSFWPRSLSFNGDGTISERFRVQGYFRRHYEFRESHDQIVSIERVFDKSGDEQVSSHKVALYLNSGSIIRVTNALHPDDAHLVAVQLTAALQEIREAAAWRG